MTPHFESLIMLTQSRLKEVYKYDLDSGNFYRLTGGHGRKIGELAGFIDKEGYVQIKVDNRRYAAHRLAWLYIHGEWPKQEIDHIDRDKLNNKICNLRDISKSINQQNHVKARITNKSTGILGTRYSARDRKFYASIVVNGKDKYLGCFNTVDDAKSAYDEAKKIYHAGAIILCNGDY